MESEVTTTAFMPHKAHMPVIYPNKKASFDSLLSSLQSKKPYQQPLTTKNNNVNGGSQGSSD